MKVKSLIIPAALAFLAVSCSPKKDIIAENVENAKIQLKSLVEASEAGDTVRIPSTFKNGEIEETGTAITRILPPIPLFSKNKENDRGKKKKSVIAKLKAFFERFFDVSGGTFNQ